MSEGNREGTLSHINDDGKASMVDVGSKPVSRRVALAEGEVLVSAKTLDLIAENRAAKGDVLAVAKIAGIQAAKKTGDLIPLCHPLPITYADVSFEIPKTKDRIRIRSSVSIVAKTGIEMEALTAVSVAALTIYDMCKAVDKSMVISEVRLISKTKEPLAPGTG